MAHKIDQRAIKTDEALVDALLDQLMNKSQPTVLDVCKKADICCNTFYKHFDNITDLITFTVQKQFQNLLPIPTKLKPKEIKHLFIQLIRIFSKFCMNNKQLILSNCEKIKTKGFSYSYIDILNKTLSYYIYKEVKELMPNKPHWICDVITDSLCGALCSIFLNQLKNNSTIDPDNIWFAIKSMNFITK